MPKELSTVPFLLLPLAETALFTLISSAGTYIGRETLMQLNATFSKLPQDKCVSFAAEGTAMTMATASFLLMVFYYIFTQNTPTARFTAARDNIHLLSGAFIPLALIGTFLNAYFNHHQPLKDAGFAAVSAATGTTGMMAGIFLIYAFASIALNCCATTNAALASDQKEVKNKETQTYAINMTPRVNADCRPSYNEAPHELTFDPVHPFSPV